jgi:hypothetical protein
MGDKWMNDGLVVYIEKDIFDKIDNKAIMKRFQNIKTQREQLYCKFFQFKSIFKLILLDMN